MSAARPLFGMTYAGFAVGKQIAITIDAIGMNTAADSPG
jgi:hypothetical protein